MMKSIFYKASQYQEELSEQEKLELLEQASFLADLSHDMQFLQFMAY